MIWDWGWETIPPLMTGILISWGPIFTPKPDLGWWVDHPLLYGNVMGVETRPDRTWAGPLLTYLRTCCAIYFDSKVGVFFKFSAKKVVANLRICSDRKNGKSTNPKKVTLSLKAWTGDQPNRFGPKVWSQRLNHRVSLAGYLTNGFLSGVFFTPKYSWSYKLFQPTKH